MTRSSRRLLRSPRAPDSSLPPPFPLVDLIGTAPVLAYADRNRKRERQVPVNENSVDGGEHFVSVMRDVSRRPQDHGTDRPARRLDGPHGRLRAPRRDRIARFAYDVTHVVVG